MSVHVYNQADTKADLYARIPADGEHMELMGDSAVGDMIPILMKYDASSSLADDFPRVIKPTLQTGNGRWLRQSNYVFPPTGSMVIWTTNTAPTGYLICDGTAISRTTYKDLFDTIGTIYGAGNGTTTFNIPDIRQRFPLGKSSSGTGSTIGDTGGSIDHIHTVNPPETTTGGPSGTVAATILAGGAADTNHTHTVNIPEFNSGPENPAFIALNFIIKY